MDSRYQNQSIEQRMTSDYKDNDDYKIEPRTADSLAQNSITVTAGDILDQKGKKWDWFKEENSEYIRTDPVSRPAHYTSGDVECIDAMKEAFGEQALKNFCRLNAFKYLWRAENKESEVQDIEKAIWYLRMSTGDDPRKT